MFYLFLLKSVSLVSLKTTIGHKSTKNKKKDKTPKISKHRKPFQLAKGLRLN